MNDKVHILEKGLIVDYLKEFELFCFGKVDPKTYLDRQVRRAEKLWEMFPDNPMYHLMQAAALIRVGKKEEGEGILKKYERNHVLQFRNPQFRACFLYLAGELTDDKIQKKNIVIQLQKLYQKDSLQPSLYWYLTRLDEGFTKNPEKKLAFLEKQWKLGSSQNLLYIEVIKTLKEYPETAGELDDFVMQCYLWGLRRRVLTKEMAAQIAKHAMKLKRCDKKYEYLIRECYRMFSTKELLAALCSFYIRDGRIDKTAAGIYSKGVEYELKLNNLYEYYMMATTEQKKKLLPEQVLLYFLYHDTLTSAQKVFLYKNIICYGDAKSEIYGKYIEKIEEYTVDCLLKRRVGPEYAFLYDHILCPQIFTKEMAEAMADIMFLRKITCSDVRIKEVEISYGQLKEQRRILFKKQQAYGAIYSPSAIVTLVDEVGNLYRNTVAYKIEKMIDEKKYVEVCREHVKNHAGLLLYLCGKKPENIKITKENESLYRQIPDTEGFTEEYRYEVILKLLEYYSSTGAKEVVPVSWFAMSGKNMTREQRGKMITFFVQHGRYEQAYAWIEEYGAVYVSANTILKILTALSDHPKAEDELYYRLCYGCFQNSQMNYTVLKYLSESFLGTCGQMMEVWKQAKAFGVETYELEERILVQMMFTGVDLPGNFDIYLSYNQREPREYLKKAYLTYMSREAFVKDVELDSRFYFLLEEELLNNQGYAEVYTLAYLKYLSKKQTLSGKQKKVCAEYLKEFFAKKCYFEFMQDFGRTITEALVLEDKLFVEYHAPVHSEVMLHYVIEKKNGENYRYTTCRMYPTYGGVYSKSFQLFEGEKITYFFTEKKEDGTEISTPSMTKVKEACVLDSVTRYGRINALRELAVSAGFDALAEEMQQCRFMEMAAEELFSIQ
ncbi:MAG: hypothetical protein IKT88_01015 [Lachnospiraceae bacterium]|nr:hypothetical protein [Lachnospiraceae bacterium]